MESASRGPGLARIVLLLIAIFALPSVLHADLDCDVYVPPGSPLDWSLWRPGNSTPIRDSVLSGMGTVKHVDDEETEIDPDATVEANAMDNLIEQVQEATSYGVTLDPWALSGVTTSDIPAHVPFWNAIPEKPLYISKAFRFTILGRFVQMLLYPEAWDRTSPTHEMISHYIEIGEPMWFGCNAIKVMGSGQAEMTKPVERIIRDVIAAVGTPDKSIPTPLTGKTPFDNFMHSMICSELSEGSPYDYDPTFGEHVLNHAEIILPYLIENALSHPHLLIQRNATYMLRYFSEPEATAALRKKLAGDDKVSRNRALIALLKRHDKTIVPFLMDALTKGEDFYFESLSVWALGALGQNNPEVEEAILKWVEPTMKLDKTINGEYVYTSCGALARLGAHSKRTLVYYSKAIKRFSMKAHYVGQALMLARAASGLEDGLGDMKKFSHGKVSKYLNCNLGLALNVYQYIGGKVRRDFLQQVIDDKSLDSLLRYHAIKLKQFQRTDIAQLKGIATDKTYPNVVRSVAMLKLWDLDRVASKSLAVKILEKYVGNNNPRGLQSAAYDSVVAIQMLGPAGELGHMQVAAILNHALKLEKQIKDKSKDNDIDSKMKFIPAPIFRQAAMEMGRTGTKMAAHDLSLILLNKVMPGRYEAAWAIGFCPYPEAVDALVIAIQDDKYGWLRWYAAKSLSMILEEDHFCDWVNGSVETRKESVTFWKERAETWKAAQAPDPDEPEED